MDQRGQEQRKEERVAAALRVKLSDDMVGIARDVSPSGVYLEMAASTAPGTTLSFQIDFPTAGGILRLSCTGEVVRVDQRDGRVGVGVRIVESKLQQADADAQAATATAD